MLLYVDIAIIIVLLCIGFYNKKPFWLWCLPIGFATTGVLLVAAYAVGNHFSVAGFFDGVLWADIRGFYPLFFGVSLICTLITECIRQYKYREAIHSSAKEGK